MLDILPELCNANGETVAGWLTGPWVGHKLFDYYRPVTSIAMLAEFRLFGQSAAVWQLVSLCFHVVSSMMLVLLIRGVFKSPLAALAGGAIWALRSRMGLVIEWTPAQTDIFAGFFAILSLLALHHGMAHRRWFFVGISGIAAILAMASKEVAFALPALATLMILHEPRVSRRTKSPLIASFWLLLGAFLIWRYHALAGFGYVPAQAKLDTPGRHFHFDSYFTNWLLFILPDALGPNTAINSAAVWTAGIVLFFCMRMAHNGSRGWLILAALGILAINFMLVSWEEWLLPSTYWSILAGIFWMGLLWIAWKERRRDLALSFAWGMLAWIPIAHPVYNFAGNVTYLPHTYWALVWACIVTGLLSLGKRFVDQTSTASTQTGESNPA
jgi:hypothetical protein